MTSAMVGLAPLRPSSSPDFVERRVAARLAPEACKPSRSLPTRATSRGVEGMSGLTFGKVSDAKWERGIAFLRRQHPIKTAECVAECTRIKPDTVRKLLAGVAEPSFRNYSRLIAVYGMEFVASIFDWAPAWFSEEERARRQASLELHLEETVAAITALREGRS